MIEKNISLKKYNTFSVETKASELFECTNIPSLIKFLKEHKTEQKILILGQGSNMLFVNDFEGTIIVMKTKGISIFEKTEHQIILKVSAGEIWDEFVSFCVENNYGGVENLSNIPGTVGASSVQNIGAYGVEAKDVISKVEVLNISNQEIEIFSVEDCKFGYRESVFKNEFKDKYIVLNVYFKLSTNPVFKLDYGTIKKELENLEINLKTIRQAIIKIRSEKLPEPKELPNAGSFFKNPIVSNFIFLELQRKFPDLIGYSLENNLTKLAAAQLIEKCGWKGRSEGNVGVHKNQSLVIVNYGNATGIEIYNFSKKIQKSVFENFGLELEREALVV